MLVRSLPDQVYALIRTRILRGEIAPGTPMRQDAIALQFGVSKIPLREALARLEQDGLLISHPNRGFAVQALTRGEVEDVFAIRLKLQPDAAAKACLVAEAEDRARVLLALTVLEDDQDSNPGYDGALHRALHMALIRPGSGMVTCQILERLHILAERYMQIDRYPAAHTASGRHDHRGLIGHWFDGQAEVVAGMVAAHLRTDLESLRLELDV